MYFGAGDVEVCPSTAGNPQPGAPGAQTPVSSRVCSPHPSPPSLAALLGPAFRTVALVSAVLAGERRDRPGPAEVGAATVLDFSPWSVVQSLAVGFFHGEKLLLLENAAALAPHLAAVLGGLLGAVPHRRHPMSHPRVPPPCPAEPGRLQCPGPAVGAGAAIWGRETAGKGPRGAPGETAGGRGLQAEDSERRERWDGRERSGGNSASPRPGGAAGVAGSEQWERRE